jgi:hypothetical protein
MDDVMEHAPPPALRVQLTVPSVPVSGEASVMIALYYDRLVVLDGTNTFLFLIVRLLFSSSTKTLSFGGDSI